MKNQSVRIDGKVYRPVVLRMEPELGQLSVVLPDDVAELDERNPENNRFFVAFASEEMVREIERGRAEP